MIWIILPYVHWICEKSFIMGSIVLNHFSRGLSLASQWTCLWSLKRYSPGASSILDWAVFYMVVFRSNKILAYEFHINMGFGDSLSIWTAWVHTDSFKRSIKERPKFIPVFHSATYSLSTMLHSVVVTDTRPCVKSLIFVSRRLVPVGFFRWKFTTTCVILFTVLFILFI